MNVKQSRNIFHVTVNVNSIVQYGIKIKNGIIKYVNVSLKIIVNAKEIIVRMPAHASVRITSI